MARRRRVDPAEGRAAVRAWVAARSSDPAQPSAQPPGPGMPPVPLGRPTSETSSTFKTGPEAATVDRQTLATAVRYLLEEIADVAPGNSVELRVPPFGVTQCVEGPRHTRGTPPNVIETDAETWLALATGSLTWPEAVAAARVTASGLRADVSPWLPLLR